MTKLIATVFGLVVVAAAALVPVLAEAAMNHNETLLRDNS